MKIIIIEDDFLIVAQIKECVERLNHEVLASFDDAREALDFVKSVKPDFVFMDIELNGPMDGIECANILKNRYSVPSIFVTSHHDTEILQESMASAPLNFLPKPFEDVNIEAVVALAAITLKLNQPKENHNIVTLQNYEFNFEYNTLKKDNEIVQLTQKELLLITLLFKNIGNIVSTQRINKYVYGNDLISDNALRRLVSRTRKKLTGLKIEVEQMQGYFISV